jgi:hypothetical protein
MQCSLVSYYFILSRIKMVFIVFTANVGHLMWATNHKIEPLNIVSLILIFISSGSKQQHNMLNRMKIEVPGIP